MARHEVKFDPYGLRVVRRGWFGPSDVAGVAWSDVERVEARRAAAGPAELVFHGPDGPVLTVDAGQRGFEALRAALPSLLPRADEAWWPALHAPPAQERRYLVWER